MSEEINTFLNDPSIDLEMKIEKLYSSSKDKYTIKDRKEIMIDIDTELFNRLNFDLLKVDDYTYLSNNFDFIKKIPNLRNLNFIFKNRDIEEIDFTHLFNINSIGKNFLVEYDNLINIELSNLPNLNKINNFFIWECKKLKTIKINLENLQIINKSFISSCDNLEIIELNFPKLNFIGDYFINNCNSLQSIELNFPKLNFIGSHFMNKCNKLQSIELNLPNINSIGNHFMNYCILLPTINLNFININIINDDFLCNCQNLKEIKLNLPNLNSIGDNFMFNCNNLQKINLNLPDLYKINNNFMNRCYNLEVVHLFFPNLYSIDNNFLNITYKLQSIDCNFTNLYSIGDNFLNNNEGLENINLNFTKIIIIGDSFISFCDKIKELKLIFQNLKLIRNGFLSHNLNLETINLVLPKLDFIGNYFINNDNKLRSIDLIFPNLKTIGNYFIFSNFHIDEIDLSNLINLESIGSNFLLYSNKAKKNVTLKYGKQKSILEQKNNIDEYRINYKLNKLKLEDNTNLNLQKMIIDMKIRKREKMLYMINDMNHPIIEEKINKWIDLQCTTNAKKIARLFKDNTRYISWKKFYQDSITVFDSLYSYIGNKTYCFFTKETLGDVNFNQKSNYWMLNLLLDHYINTNKTNLPKELLLCDKRRCIVSNYNYDYYIAIDDCIYSGGQMFYDVIRVENIDKNKIIVVSPYISQYAYDNFYKERTLTYHELFFAEIMNYWWKDKTITLDKMYDLNIRENREIIYSLLDKFFPSPRLEERWDDNNFMYYFDHKIADYASSFPSVYHLGIIIPINNELPELQFQYTGFMTFDKEYNVVVANSLNHCINVYQYKNHKIGSLIKTIGSFGSNEGQFNNPSSMVLDDIGNIIIADTKNNRIQILRYSDSNHIRTIDGNEIFKFPICVILDNKENFIIRDLDGGIHIFRISDGIYLRSIKSTIDIKGIGSMKFDPDDNLVVVDNHNHCLHIINYDGKYIRTIGSSGSGEGQLNNPLDIDFMLDYDDSLYIIIADFNNHRGQMLNYKDGSFIESYNFNAIGILVDIDNVIIINNNNNIISLRLETDDTDITYDDSRNRSIVCLNTSYFPFIDNCLNPNPIMDDIDEKAKTNPEKLCVEPWYKKKYNDKYDKKILALDFDYTLTDIEIKDDQVDKIDLDLIFKNKNELIEILKLAWEKIVTVYIVSRRQKEIIIFLLKKFYSANNITFYQIYEENILGRPTTFSYPFDFNESNKQMKNIFWAKEKVKYLEDICIIENVNKNDILFCDDLDLNINFAQESGFTNSIIIDRKQNAIQVLLEFNRFISSVSNYQKKYLKYKQKYILLQRGLLLKY